MKRASIAALLLSGCAGQPHLPPLDPIVKTQTVMVATPVPCPAFAKLGDEPTYDDSADALATAPDIFEQTRLLLKGRLQRTNRLAQYVAARAACTF